MKPMMKKQISFIQERKQEEENMRGTKAQGIKVNDAWMHTSPLVKRVKDGREGPVCPSYDETKTKMMI
jgi:hypothetical protein